MEMFHIGNKVQLVTKQRWKTCKQNHWKIIAEKSEFNVKPMNGPELSESEYNQSKSKIRHYISNSFTQFFSFPTHPDVGILEMTITGIFFSKKSKMYFQISSWLSFLQKDH